MSLTTGNDLVATDATHEQDVNIIELVASQTLIPATHRRVTVDTTAGSVILPLPPASSSGGVVFFVHRSVTISNTLSLVPDGSDLINGSNDSISLPNLYDWIEVISNGISWMIINESASLETGTTLNVVDVFEPADLPDTLVNGTNYVLHAPITVSTSKTFPSGGDVEWSSTNVATNKITYDGTGTFIIGTGAVGVRLNVQIDSSSTGTLFGITGSGGANSFIFWGNGGADGWDDLGTYTSFGALIQENVIMSNFSASLKSVDTTGYFSTLTNWFNLSDQSIDFIIWDDTIERITIANGSYTPFPNERIFNIDAAADVFAFISLIQNPNGDRYFNSAGLDSTDPGVICQNCADLEDSGTSAELTLTGNTAVTDIPAVGALVEINLDVSWLATDVERLIVNTDGSVESIAKRSAKIKIDGNINLKPASSAKSLSIKTVLVKPPALTVTFTNGTNLINDTATARSDGDLISFRDTAGTLPAELRTDVVYYVVSQLTNSFQVSYTSGGSAIAFTDDGTPVNSYKEAELHGSTPTNTIANGSPRDLIPQATVPATINSDSFQVVINNDDAVDIEVNHGYQRYFV